MSDTESTCTPGEKGLAEANNYMAVHMHRLLAKENGNVFVSPFSLSTAMAMLLCAAEGETESEMRKVLGYDHAGLGKDDITSAFQQQIASLMNSNDSYTLTSANSLLCRKGFKVKEQYKSVIEESFKALISEVNFAEVGKVVKQINDWVKENTKGMIPKFIDNINPANVMVILNAVYFKGSWLSKFDKAKTTSQKFYNKGDETKGKSVEMMHMKRSFPIVRRETFQALQLPYEGKEIAMLILLPRSKNGLSALEDTLTPTFIHDLSRDMFERDVTVALPRFRLEYSKDVLENYESLGIKKLFRDPDLGGANVSLSVSLIFHKAVFEVNEEGSEASAATIGALRCLPPEFIVDHPFAFVIYNVKSSLILFMGRVEEL